MTHVTEDVELFYELGARIKPAVDGVQGNILPGAEALRAMHDGLDLMQGPLLDEVTARGDNVFRSRLLAMTALGPMAKHAVRGITPSEKVREDAYRGTAAALALLLAIPRAKRNEETLDLMTGELLQALFLRKVQPNDEVMETFGRRIIPNRRLAWALGKICVLPVVQPIPPEPEKPGTAAGKRPMLQMGIAVPDHHNRLVAHSLAVEVGRSNRLRHKKMEPEVAQVRGVSRRLRFNAARVLTLASAQKDIAKVGGVGEKFGGTEFALRDIVDILAQYVVREALPDQWQGKEITQPEGTEDRLKGKADLQNGFRLDVARDWVLRAALWGLVDPTNRRGDKRRVRWVLLQYLRRPRRPYEDN